MRQFFAANRNDAHKKGALGAFKLKLHSTVGKLVVPIPTATAVRNFWIKIDVVGQGTFTALSFYFVIVLFALRHITHFDLKRSLVDLISGHEAPVSLLIEAPDVVKTSVAKGYDALNEIIKLLSKY